MPLDALDDGTTYDKWYQQLARWGQEHLLTFWSQLDSTARQQLVEQLQTIDFELMDGLSRRTSHDEDWETMAMQAESPPAVRLADTSPQQTATALALGEQALRSGRVGVVLVAGGQGSRLGFPHPKGMFPIGPVSRRSLFQVHVDRLLSVARRYQAKIPLYLMTSPATHDETVSYFQQHQYLGMEPSDQILFCQGTMPAVDAETGKLLLEAPGQLFLSPDGHGGMLSALERSGALRDMERRGVDLLFYLQVDNPLVAIADPVFLGHHLLASSDITTQVVAKQEPLDKVGNVILHKGRVHVIEYSDLPEVAAHQRLANGELAIWAGSIAVHAISVPFLRRALTSAESLPFHLARKAVPHINQRGERIQPASPNAIKFERFIFDLLPLAENAIVVEIDERQGFAPLKNAAGAAKDTEQTVHAAMIAQHRSWIETAGGAVADGVRVEISPLYAYDATELAARIPRGMQVNDDRFFV